MISVLLSGCATSQPHKNIPDVLDLYEVTRLTYNQHVELTLTTGETYTVKQLVFRRDSTSFTPVRSSADHPSSVAIRDLESFRMLPETSPGSIGLLLGLGAGVGLAFLGRECNSRSCIGESIAFPFRLLAGLGLGMIGGMIGSQGNRSAPKGIFVISLETGEYVVHRVDH